MKSTQERMNEIYGGDPSTIPWNITDPPPHLLDLLDRGIVRPGKTVDLGCGRGNYSCFLAERGFEVTGIDFSDNAIEAAKKNAEERSAGCRFYLMNMITDLGGLEERFNFAFEWEILHHIFPPQRDAYLKNVRSILCENALYFAVHFAEEDKFFEESGKYKKTPIGTKLYFSSLEECRTLYEKYFSIRELRIDTISAAVGEHKIIYALLEKG